MTSAERALLLEVAKRHAKEGTGRKIREDAKVSPTTMALAVGITTNGLWRWERGQRTPQDDAAIRWVQALETVRKATHAATAA